MSAFENPLYDPFNPEMVIADSKSGPVIDVLPTVQNYGESLLPELSASDLRLDDKLSITFDDDTAAEYTVTKAAANSLAFGSGEIIRPSLDVVDQDGISLRLEGSAISPAGTMITLGAVKAGQHLVAGKPEDGGHQVSVGIIKDFSVKRRFGSDGEYREVPPNQLAQTTEMSAEFTAVQEQFARIRNLIESTGVDLDAPDERGIGYQTFLTHNHRGLLYASRQGFGSAVTPQYKIYSYDAADELLRAVRAIPGKDVLQVAVMPLEPDALADSEYVDSWQGIKMLDPGVLHRSLDHSPFFVTYSWQNPGQTTPVVTVRSRQHGLDQAILRPDSGPVLNYVPVEVNIETVDDQVDDQSVQISAAGRPYWANAERYQRIVDKYTSATIEPNYLDCKIGDLAVKLHRQPTGYLNAMEAAVKGLI